MIGWTCDWDFGPDPAPVGGPCGLELRALTHWGMRRKRDAHRAMHRAAARAAALRVGEDVFR